ncbi:Glycosyl hydrolase family 47 [Novymonas esmeraldas]|uniref:alpha-1,2-Mannosidase n=1 Tax=Novymonas esmeraldas TaxID=1808958 RepID=A0AAW0EXU6_9TRYP
MFKRTPGDGGHVAAAPDSSPSSPLVRGGGSSAMSVFNIRRRVRFTCSTLYRRFVGSRRLTKVASILVVAALLCAVLYYASLANKVEWPDIRPSTETPAVPTTKPPAVPTTKTPAVPTTEGVHIFPPSHGERGGMVSAALSFCLDAADAELDNEAAWTKHAAATPTAPLQRAAPGEVHPIQAEMLPFVRDMLDHALHGYFRRAFPHDDLKSLTGGFTDTFGGVGITLLDSLDMLALMGRPRTFRHAAKWVEEHLTLSEHVMAASAFEVNIRGVGGLLAAHFMYEEGVVPVVQSEHNYKGGLADMARDLGDRLMRTFETPSGLPMRMIRLRDGIASNPMTSNADAGTYLLEFSALSRVTGNQSYARAARLATQTLHDMRESATQLMNTGVDAMHARWSSRTASVGACIDSTIEYSVKHHVLSGEVAEWREFETDRRASSAWLRGGGFYYNLAQGSGAFVDRVTQGLSAFYPSTMLLGGHHTEAMEGVWATHGLHKRLGVLDEITNLQLGTSRVSNYNLRPEHIESIYYLYRSTHDPAYLQMGREFALGLQLRARVPFGLATMFDTSLPHNRERLKDYMESFAIAETLKYLYLLFDEASPIHRRVGSDAAGTSAGWVFTTEAHPFPNTVGNWELDEALVRSGRRRPPVPASPAAHMFDYAPAGAARTEVVPPLDEAELAEVARARQYRDNWVARLSHGRMGGPGASPAENLAAGLKQWEQTSGLDFAALRHKHLQRRTQWLESVDAARVRHVRGLLCATYERLRRRRTTPALRRSARDFQSRMRELGSVCAGHGPSLSSPFAKEAPPPFLRGPSPNPVHLHHLNSVGDGAYTYFCDIRHRSGVNQLSKGVYRPPAPLHTY